MPSFRFEASDSAGHIEKGLVEAESAPAARAALRAKGLVPLEVSGLATGGAQRVAPRRPRFSEAELALATRQIASPLAARLPGAQALRAAIEPACPRTARRVPCPVSSGV